MKTILYFLLLLLLNFSLLSCQDVIELEVPEGRTRLVVDALVSDAEEIQTVKLNYSAPYFSNQALPPAGGAEVIIRSDQGESFTLIEEEENEGVYQAAFQAQVGSSYQLYIKTADGAEYQSHMQRMEAVGSLDAIYYDFQPKSAFNEEEGYLVSIECSDIPGVENYYRWRFFINDEFQGQVQSLWFGKDQFADGNQNLIVTFYNHLLQEGDEFRVEQMSVTKEAFQFMNLLYQQANGGGSPFSPPPAPIRGNVIKTADPDDYALGFFMVSSVVSAEVSIQPIAEE